MGVERTEAERAAAVESMYRIRAVESPPDERGQRTIWHRGSRGAELVSWVDAEGRLIRQEFVLFDDVLVWDRVGLLKTGVSVPAEGSKLVKPSDGLTYDTDEAAKAQRLERLSAALKTCGGVDRFLSNLRGLLITDTAPFLGDEPVAITREAPAVREAFAQAARVAQEPSTTGAGWTKLAIGVGLVLVAIAVLVLITR
jgi:hypothetical protein